MKVFVTGGAGYIGSHITLELLEAGHDVVVYDDLSLGFKENVDSRAHFIEGSTLDKNFLKKSLVNEFDVVVHMAAFKAAGESMTDPAKYSQNNLNGTINLLNVMTELGINDFIFSSTAAVYGYPNYLPIDEAHDLKPINFYGYTKLVIEQSMQWYADLMGLRYVALRYFNAAGYDINGRIRFMEQNPANLLPIVMQLASGRIPCKNDLSYFSMCLNICKSLLQSFYTKILFFRYFFTPKTKTTIRSTAMGRF